MKKILTIVTMLATVLSMGYATELTFEQFKESCRNPGAYGHQNPPTMIKLQCRNTKEGWQPIESGSTGLAESRFITSELFSSKHTVGARTAEVNVPERVAMCPRFRGVMEKAAIEVALTCDQVLTEERTLSQLCLDEINSAINENPDLVEVTPNGAIFSVCSEQQQQQQQDQRTGRN